MQSEMNACHTENPAAAKGWWAIRFRIKWPENKEPSWHIDLLLAHKIIAPVLKQYGNDVSLWRFHRRAARDEEGHQFSFLFYAASETAGRVIDMLQYDTLIKKMKRSKMILQDIYDDPKNIIRPNIEHTSDANWSPVIKKSWPYFIMGVCEMWISIMNEISAGNPLQKTESVKKIAAYYEQMNKTVTGHWREEGGHSLLHHLNAIFGYEPVLVHEVNLRRF